MTDSVIVEYDTSSITKEEIKKRFWRTWTRSSQEFSSIAM